MVAGQSKRGGIERGDRAGQTAAPLPQYHHTAEQCGASRERRYLGTDDAQQRVRQHVPHQDFGPELLEALQPEPRLAQCGDQRRLRRVRTGAASGESIEGRRAAGGRIREQQIR